MSGSVSSPESSKNTSPCSVGFMVPSSTLRYGSILTRFILKPRAASILPIDAVDMPLPTPDMTPPMTKIYLCPLLGPRRATIRTLLYHTSVAGRATILCAQVPANGQVTRKYAERDTGAHDDKE